MVPAFVSVPELTSDAEFPYDWLALMVPKFWNVPWLTSDAEIVPLALFTAPWGVWDVFVTVCTVHATPARVAVDEPIFPPLVTCATVPAAALVSALADIPDRLDASVTPSCVL